jgi:Tol biopolymer transport system component
MSPEQAQGKPLDARSDIFSFGVVLYEMATGVRPFRASSSASPISAVINDEPPVPTEVRRDLPHDLERIILRCLRKDPARRYQVMADLAVELEDVRTASGTRVAGAPRHEARSMRWALAGGLVAAAAAALMWWPNSRVVAPTVSASMTPLTTFAHDERWPSLSPDGNQVAFTWSGENGDNEDLYVVPVGVGTPLRLTSDPSPDRSAAWSPDGSQIAFVRVAGRERTLYVTPPIPNAERRIATVLAPFSEVGDLVRVSWLPDGRRLVLTAGDETGEMLGIVTISLSGEMTRLIWSPRSEGSYRLPAVSPDGRSLAYAMCRATFACDLYVVPMDGNLRTVGDPRRLTPASAIAVGLAWAADGHAIIYGWQAEYQSYLWRVRLDGSAPERIDLAGELASHPSVSARGHLLAYQRSTNDRDVWRFTASGAGEPIASSTRYDSFPSYSPDGRRIAFESNRLGRLQVWTANADGSNARPLTEPDSGGQGSPRWSRDGLWIAYDEQLPEGPQGVFVVPSDGGTGRKVAVGSIPAWSADGRLYFDRSGAIWRVSTNGGG